MTRGAFYEIELEALLAVRVSRSSDQHVKSLHYPEAQCSFSQRLSLFLERKRHAAISKWTKLYSIPHAVLLPKPPPSPSRSTSRRQVIDCNQLPFRSIGFLPLFNPQQTPADGSGCHFSAAREETRTYETYAHRLLDEVQTKRRDARGAANRLPADTETLRESSTMY